MTETQYSADIDIYLEVDGMRIDVAGCQDNICILRNAAELPPTQAVLVIIVDGKERRKPVFLELGMSLDSTTVEYRADFEDIDNEAVPF